MGWEAPAAMEVGHPPHTVSHYQPNASSHPLILSSFHHPPPTPHHSPNAHHLGMSSRLMGSSSADHGLNRTSNAFRSTSSGLNGTSGGGGFHQFVLAIFSTVDFNSPTGPTSRTHRPRLSRQHPIASAPHCHTANIDRINPPGGGGFPGRGAHPPTPGDGGGVRVASGNGFGNGWQPPMGHMGTRADPSGSTDPTASSSSASLDQRTSVTSNTYGRVQSQPELHMHAYTTALGIQRNNLSERAVPRAGGGFAGGGGRSATAKGGTGTPNSGNSGTHNGNGGTSSSGSTGNTR